MKDKGISARIINMGTIKPLDIELTVKAAQECKKIVTVEEHTIFGGLGEAVCGAVTEFCPVPVKRIGINDVFGFSAEADELMEYFGLWAANIADTTEKFLQK